MSTHKIGVIGLGLMGRPMAANLLKAGHSLTIWNRTASRAQDLITAGAKLAGNPREVALQLADSPDESRRETIQLFKLKEAVQHPGAHLRGVRCEMV